MVHKRLKKLFPRRRSSKTPSGTDQEGGGGNSASAAGLGGDNRRRSSASTSVVGALGGHLRSGSGTSTSDLAGTGAAERRPTNQTSINESESTSSGLGQVADLAHQLQQQANNVSRTLEEAGPPATVIKTEAAAAVSASDATATTAPISSILSSSSATAAKDPGMTNGSPKAEVKNRGEEAISPDPKAAAAAPEGRRRESANPPPPPPPRPVRVRSSGDPPLTSSTKRKMGAQSKDAIFDDPKVIKSYDNIPLLEITKLPRGGISMETQAVGRVQFGIPPETIKDSMVLGLGVPSVYIVPVERFCREMGPALGVNLAEFEFPAYFNFFVQRKRCTLIVDSDDAEKNIRRVFSETLLGPIQFRREKDPIPFEEEDFADTFPREAIPDFQKEFKHFRIMPDGKELVLETLLKFNHFHIAENGAHEGLGVPPLLVEDPGLEERLNKNSGRSKRHSDTDMVEDDKRKSYIQSQQVSAAGADSGADAAYESASDLRKVAMKLEREEKKKTWSYSQAKWIGDVATIYPDDATPEQVKAGTTKRVEVFKMPGGSEYILHDVDENNVIVGKARFSGHVRVSEAMSVDGFGGKSFMDGLATARRKSDQLSDSDDEYDLDEERQVEEAFGTNKGIPRPILPPTFHPPSFGVTVLGNSHGFDKSGSVSGYVLWVNGRGVMIDPPPYSSATLEREGIRPRMIVGIIITHCHADHDAGTFQKVLTGSQVVVITTPTIYKSFIRKYSALSALSPALLRHSHRYKPAIIGSPLRFQGANFFFTYSLHTIPCVGFRVEWRGRSMVFTGDHFNSPEGIQKMEDAGTLSKGRAEDLRNLPLQDTDCLLHEAGAPPIHTPLDVLMKLPPKVKKRLYIVHTSNLPEDCDLKVAPTGTAGTIRLDQVGGGKGGGRAIKRSSILQHMPQLSEDSLLSSGVGEYDSTLYEDSSLESGSMKGPGNMSRMSSLRRMPRSGLANEPPLVSLRQPSSTDAWFILNLLSAVPFLSSLSYASTMEVLETARVDAFCQNDIVVPASRRHETLVVVWEGTCMEREISSQTASSKSTPINDRRVSTYHPQGQHRPLLASEMRSKKRSGAVWFAGDWTGPRALQPEKRLSGESSTSKTHDIVAMSSEGVKVITVEFSNLHAILQDGSPLYRKYLSRRTKQIVAESITEGNETFDHAVRNLNIIELLECNSALRKLSAVQKRHLESLAEGPVFFNTGQRLWRQGDAVDKAFIIVAGTASFVHKRRNAGSVSVASHVMNAGQNSADSVGFLDDDGDVCQRKEGRNTLGAAMRVDALKAIQQLGPQFKKDDNDGSDSSSISPAGGSLLKDEEMDQFDSVLGKSNRQESFNDLTKLSRGLQKRADSMTNYSDHNKIPNEFDTDSDSSSSSDDGDDDSIDDDEVADEIENIVSSRRSSHGAGTGDESGSRTSKTSSRVLRRRSSRDRFANKVLGRLYESRAFTAGLVFSRGHFLGDVSKMVAGLLAKKDITDDSSAQYGFGGEGSSSRHGYTPSYGGPPLVVDNDDDKHVVHSSTLAAGKDGCVVLVFPKSSLIPFMDEHPGLLLSLLGTQVVV